MFSISLSFWAIIIFSVKNRGFFSYLGLIGGLLLGVSLVGVLEIGEAGNTLGVPFSVIIGIGGVILIVLNVAKDLQRLISRFTFHVPRKRKLP